MSKVTEMFNNIAAMRPAEFGWSDIAEVIILAVLIYVCWPVLQVVIPAIFKEIVWLFKMLFKGIRKLFELIGSLFKKRKNKKEEKKK